MSDLTKEEVHSETMRYRLVRGTTMGDGQTLMFWTRNGEYVVTIGKRDAYRGSNIGAAILLYNKCTK